VLALRIGFLVHEREVNHFVLLLLLVEDPGLEVNTLSALLSLCLLDLLVKFFDGPPLGLQYFVLNVLGDGVDAYFLNSAILIFREEHSLVSIEVNNGTAQALIAFLRLTELAFSTSLPTHIFFLL